MSYPDPQPLQSQPSFQLCAPQVPLQTPYQSGNDVIGVWPQFPINNNEQFDPHSQFEQHQPPSKRPKTSEDDNNQLMNSRMPPPNNLPVNKGTTNIFFKTKMCVKFKTGSCRNGETCNFAHGEQDKRQPPPNWQELVGLGVRGAEEDRPVGNWDDDQRIIHRMKLCKKFYNGEVCPYGNRCNFLHEDPGKFRGDAGRFRESAAISIGTTGQPMGQGSVGQPIGQGSVGQPIGQGSVGQPMGQGSCGFNVTEVNGNVNNAVNGAVNVKSVYWRTKLCTKWEITGQCAFGDKCHFAHGIAELQLPGGHTEEVGNLSTILTKPPSSILVNNASPTNTMSVPSLLEEGQSNKCLLKWKGSKKINRIYGDWLDDLPLVNNFTNEVES